VKIRRGPATVTEDVRRTQLCSHWPRGREGAAEGLGSQETCTGSATQSPSWKGVTLHSRALLAALVGACASSLFAAPAIAAPTEVTVRIEGEAETLFEGPILTDGHDVRAASDATDRRCDGTNGGANPSPGPTPTAAAVDAMAIAGEDFDGTWFAGLDDYYVERWGPDEESFEGAGAFWGVLLDGVLATVGGCQSQVSAGEEVLWALDAFNLSRPFLRLAPEEEGVAGDPGAPLYAEAGEPLELIVHRRVYGGVPGVPPAAEPAAGVPVKLVSTDPETGFQSPGAVAGVSGGDGGAEVVLAAPGWHRLKAAEDSGHIRSNRLDVCVRPAGGGDCGPPPPDAVPRTPPAGSPAGPGEDPGGGAGAGSGQGGTLAAPGIATPAPTALARRGALRFGFLRAHPRRGVATIGVRVPGPGRLALFGRQVRKRLARPEAARLVRLLVRPKPGPRRLLRRHGRAKVVVRVAFRPRAGRRLQPIRRRLTLRLAG